MILNMLISGAEKFLTEWPEQPVLEQHDPAVFEYLLTRSDVDELIDNDCLSRKYLAVVRGGVITDSREYVPQDSQMPRRGSIRRFYNEGCTISLRGVQGLRPAVAKLCAEVGAATGYPTHANAYYTPPGTCGLRYHWDSYVTLVVQLSGTKAWPVHPPMVPNTTREYLSFTETGFTDGQLTYLANTPPREYVLRPGDVFWLPRGWVHAPHAIGDGPSLHLTIGIKQRTLHWLASELAGEVLAQALIDPELRSEATPAQLLGGGPAVDEMRKYLIGALLRMKPDEAAEVVRAAALKPV